VALMSEILGCGWMKLCANSRSCRGCEALNVGRSSGVRCPLRAALLVSVADSGPDR
jgi:hypothetical protein